MYNPTLIRSSGLLMSLSLTRLHNRGNRMPPCGQMLVTDPSRISPEVWLKFSCYPAWTLPTDKLYSQSHGSSHLHYNFKCDTVNGLFNTKESSKCYFPSFHCILYMCGHIVQCSFSILTWLESTLVLM